MGRPIIPSGSTPDGGVLQQVADQSINALTTSQRTGWASPPEGAYVRDVEQNLTYVWNGSAWKLGIPEFIISSPLSIATGPGNGGGAEVTISDSTMTVGIYAGVTYEIKWTFAVQFAEANNAFYFRGYRGATQLFQLDVDAGASWALLYKPYTFSIFDSPATNLYDYKMTIQQRIGSGNITIPTQYSRTTVQAIF